MTMHVCDPLWDFRPYAINIFFQDGLQSPQQLVFFDFFFFSFHFMKVIFPLPTDEVSAMCDAF